MAHPCRISKGLIVRGGVLAALAAGVAGGLPSAGAAGGPSLGAARSYAILGASTVENVGLSLITGDVGVSPGTAIIGFPPATITDGALHAGDAAAAAAHSDAVIAYAFLLGMAQVPANNLTSLDLGGMTLLPGVYTFNSSAQLTGALTLDAGGASDALFVFQVGSTLTTASGASVSVINGGADYDESNVFWQIGSSATLGSGTSFVGNILAYADITMVTGTTMTGNALCTNGAVYLDANSVTSPPEAIPLPPAPENFTAAPIGLDACEGMDLAWIDASDNETEFRVFRRDGAGPAFALVGTVLSADMPGTGSTVTFQDLDLPPSTTLTYRVTAFSPVDGESVPSAEALVETCDELPVAVLAPVNLAGAPILDAACTGADLTWNDASDNEAEFRVYRRDGASPDYVLVGTVVATDTPGSGGAVAFQDLILDPASFYTYRVTASSTLDGESLPSNEALVETCVVDPPMVSWMTVNLGRRRSALRARDRRNGDRVVVRGSYTQIDVEDGVPVVVHDMDPRESAISVQVRAPGNMVLLAIPAGDAGWKSHPKGVYSWHDDAGQASPGSSLRIDTRKSEFTFKSWRNDFGATPVNAITVALTCDGATGSDVRAWDHRDPPRDRTEALFTIGR